VLFTGLLVTFITAKQRSWLAFVTTVAVALLCLALSLYLFRAFRLVFVPTRPVLAILTIYPVLTMISYWQRERRERWVRGAFGSMVSDQVLNYLEEHPTEVTLTGHRCEATVMFTDIRGFSGIAESMEAKRLTELLNAYLSPMTSIIMDHDGYVDKYVGDMIMAEWGVPFSTPDHALKACLAALAQTDFLARLRPELKERFEQEIHIRVGINTGMLTAGNVGSDQRFQYTVIGDAVNLAKRLEPLNKDYGTTIVIGHTTFVQARDAIEARLLDRVKVAGRSEEVLVYELLARKGELPAQKQEVVRLYESALRLTWEAEQWEQPVQQLCDALTLDKTDTPSINLLQRITGMHVDPDALPNTKQAARG